ncbi:MAG: CHRD domain-containing protein [Sedimentisphaerales bacterium]|nr:CHRD domain-containing protein [Sedimentisphaerales bacterium]
MFFRKFKSIANSGSRIELRLYMLFCAASAAILALSSVAGAEIANLNVAADTFINSGWPNNNAGTTGWFDAGRDGAGGIRRGLFRFDLSSIPAGSTITSAEVQLTVVKVPGQGPTNSTFDLFRLRADWNEGSKGGNNGSNASNGEATWNARMRGTANWTSPGAKSDAVATSSASAAVSSSFNARYSWSGAGLVDDVQFWLDNPSQNFGWLLTSRAESSSRSVRGFAARQSGANAGKLIVNYTAPPPPNSAPFIFITSPLDGASFVSPGDVTIETTALDSDGTITKVEFFDNTTSLGSVTSVPFASMYNLYAGTHSLTAVATDNNGATATSEQVTINVNTVPIENPIPEPIVKGDITIELKTIVDGLSAPLGMAVPDDGSERMFVYDQAGLVWVVTENAGKLPTPLMDVNDRLVSLGRYDERGLLGLATHPYFTQFPFIYTYTSEPVDGPADFVNVMPEGVENNHQSVIAEWQIYPNDPNRVDPNSRREILRIDQPQSNHNGGTLRFGPDGFLYISLGDGGRANDVADGHVPGGNAQSLQRIYGKVIRIDVNGSNSANGQYGIPKDNPFEGTDSVQEIYAYGLRNPYTYSFDSLTGDLYLGDAGQNNIEEVDIIVNGGNYGWNLREGSFWFDSVTDNIGSVVTGPVRPEPPDLIDPIAEYDHDEGAVVVGGYVYRGTQIPALQGRYVFGDWGSFGAPSARLFTLDPNFVIEELRIGLADRPADFWLRGFGQDADGELYIFGSTVLGPSGDTGVVLKIMPSNTQFIAELSGAAAGTDSQATGQASFELRPDGNSISYQLEVQGIENVNMAHIHIASEPGGDGPPAVWLYPDAPPATLIEGEFTGLLAEGQFTDANLTGPLEGLTLDDLLTAINENRAYVNVHTQEFPAGAIRGPLQPVIPPTPFAAELSGAAAGTDSQAIGQASFELHPDDNSISYRLEVHGIENVNMAHIHIAPDPGGDGPPAIWLYPSTPPALLIPGEFSGVLAEGIFTAADFIGPLEGGTLDDLIAAIEDNRAYVNIHTEQFPAGEIRGQLQ